MENILRERTVSAARDLLGIREGSSDHLCLIVNGYNDHDYPLPRGYTLKPSDPWCAAYVSVAAANADNDDIIPTEVSCTEMMKAFQAQGSWVEDDNYIPAPGDVIFFNWQHKPGSGPNTGSPDHVGIVDHVSDGIIYSDEGNRENRSKCVEIAVGDYRIRGYGIPDYAGKAAKLAPADTEDTSLDALAMEVIGGKWGNNPDRRIKLIRAGYDYEAVQGRVNQIIARTVNEVIDGKWGNNPDRREKLAAAGFDPTYIQKLVNKKLRK